MAADLKPVDAVSAEIGDLPTYGYRRAGALVNRRRTAAGLAAFNQKRFYRVMKAHALLLPKAPKRVASARVHDGKVTVAESNRPWCSDGFEIGCDNGEVVTGVFLKDCCAREIIWWRAWSSRGLPGEPVRDMLIEGVESRFGEAKVAGDVELEFLSDNGGAYRAKDTHALVKDLGIKSVHTPVCSPQSNGMAESFVNTFKRDYVSQMDRSSAAIVLRCPPQNDDDVMTFINSLRTFLNGSSSHICCVAAVFCVSFVMAPNVYALDPHATLSDYYLDVWTAKEGAPSDVLAFTQTPDGWLWLGGHNGLFRFDGVRFERFVPVSGDPLPKAPITTLRAEPNGDLWIGYTSAGLSVLRQGKLTHVASSRPDSPISSATYSIVVDTDNSVWAATSLGLRHYSGGKWNIIGEEANIPPPPGTTDNVGIDRTGQLWVTNSHTVYRLARQSGKFEPVGLHGTASSLIHSPDGRYWHSAGTKLTLLSNSANSSQRRRDAVTSDVGKFDRDGNFWTIDCEGAAVCLWRGVGARPGTKPGTTFVLDKNALDRPSPRSPLYGAVGLKLFEDRDANIWISTNIGIVRLRDKRIKKAPIPASKSMKIAMDGEGRAYVHAASQNVWALHNRHDSAVVAKGVDTFTASLSGDTLLAIPGYIQFGFQADARKIPLPQAEGETIPNVGSVTYDGVSMWVYIRRRVFWRYRAGRWESTWSWLAPICKPRSSAPAGVGEVWFGCRDGSAVRITGDNVTKFGPAQGLDFENASFVDARDGILVGGSDGTAILSGTRFFRIQAEDPRVLYNVVGIAKAPNGDRYLNGARGLVYVKAADWRAMTAQPTQPLRYTLIDTLDGYPGAATSLIEGMAIDSAGILWFGGSEGIASLDTKAPLRKASPSPVFVTALETPTQRYRASDGMVLPAGSSGLRIDYTALGYTMPERIRFRYRLDGVDRDWVEAGTRRAAYYTNLGPGEHRFSVIATNEDGVWSRSPATFTFMIKPTVVQSRPFIAACVVLALGLMYLLHRLRLYRLERRIVERMRTRQLERERIARLLHDTFLQSVQGLTYAFQGLANTLPAQSTMRSQMERLLDMAENVIVEGRNNVSALRTPPARDVEHDLTALAQSLAEAFPVQFSFTATGTRRGFNPIVADELHLFAREAIFNACRHAQAERVTVTLEYDARFVRLCVRDDGRGIDPQVLAEGAPAGHWGLRGLRERAEGMGATLEMESSPGKGTLICLRVGAEVAYQVR